jgi:hypothetical protein
MKHECTSFLLVFVILLFSQEDSQAGDPSKQRGESSRALLSKPSSLFYEREADTKHRYTFSGIYTASEETREAGKAGKSLGGGGGGDSKVEDPFGSSIPSANYPEDIYRSMIPDCSDITVDFKERKCSFVTSRKLELWELADVFDQLAGDWGDFPYWIEMENRGVKKSKEFEKKNYLIEEFTGEPPANLAWFSVPENRQISTLIGVNESQQGKLMFNPTTAFCMCHSRFAIRVLDEEGCLVWQDESLSFGGVRFAVADINSDGLHDILLDRYDHGETKRFLIKRSIEQAEAPKP